MAFLTSPTPGDISGIQAISEGHAPFESANARKLAFF
jgi:hypothetical protein